jgi:rare lipoprotein A (peptidoglycan hydrolase)
MSRTADSILRAVAPFAAAASLAACVQTGGDRAEPLPQQPRPPTPSVAANSCTPSFSLTGTASWYGPGFHLKRTASGEPFYMDELTAAHRSLPLNTVVRVTNLANQRTVILRINDRGPYVRGRILDVSRYAAEQLSIKNTGTARVRVEVFDLRGDAPSSTVPERPMESARDRLVDGPPPTHPPMIGASLEQQR